MLTDAEVGDFSYALANEREFAAVVARGRGVETSAIERRFAEAHGDPVLAERLRARGTEVLYRKRRTGLGPRLAWYAAVRELRPQLVVETGVSTASARCCC